MSKVCHTCPLWMHLRGKNPNTGEDVDEWNCSLAFMPMLLIENAKQIRSTAAAQESFRNEVVNVGNALMQVRRKAVDYHDEPPGM